MTNPNEPAFPELHIHHFQNEDSEGKHDNVVPRWHGGLTKREYFAAQAMSALLKDPLAGVDYPANQIAEMSIEFADALIAELNKI